MQLCKVKSGSWGHTSEVTTLKQAMWLLTNNTCFIDTVTKRRLLCSAMRRHTARHASAGWRRLHNTTCCGLAGQLRACHTMVVMNFTTHILDFSNICAIHGITGVSCELCNEFHKWRKIRIYRIIPFVIKCMFTPFTFDKTWKPAKYIQDILLSVYFSHHALLLQNCQTCSQIICNLLKFMGFRYRFPLL